MALPEVLAGLLHPSRTGGILSDDMWALGGNWQPPAYRRVSRVHAVTGGLESNVTAEAAGIARNTRLGTTGPTQQGEMLGLARPIDK